MNQRYWPLAGLSARFIRYWGPQGEPAPEPPQASDLTSPLGRRVLLVDDSRTNRLLGLSILKRMGYEADSVESGPEALEAALTGDYGLVLMDIWMPGMDGFETTAELRRLPEPFCSIPVVAMTAHVGAAERKRCLEAGMNDHVSKPVDRPVLSAILQRLIGPPRGGGADSRKAGAAETKADAVLLDGETLEQLRNDAGPALVGELIAAFMAETGERLPRMRTAVESGDLDTVAAEAHAMKSSSGTFGALRLYRLVGQIESAATESRPDLVSELFGRLPTLVEESWREFTRVGYPPSP